MHHLNKLQVSGIIPLHWQSLSNNGWRENIFCCTQSAPNRDPKIKLRPENMNFVYHYTLQFTFLMCFHGVCVSFSLFLLPLLSLEPSSQCLLCVVEHRGWGELFFSENRVLKCILWRKITSKWKLEELVSLETELIKFVNSSQIISPSHWWLAVEHCQKVCHNVLRPVYFGSRRLDERWN